MVEIHPTGTDSPASDAVSSGLVTHGTTAPDPAWQAVAGLAGELVAAWGCWAPTLTPDGSRVAYVSDRLGTPRLWVQDATELSTPLLIELSDDPVLNVSWSPDAQWLACSVATGGGVRTEVWVVRPDGTGARRVAGGDEHAVLGPWARRGHGLVITRCSDEPNTPNECVLLDPDDADGDEEVVARGWLINILDLTADGRFTLLRDGTRGAQFCRLVDRADDADHPVLPYPQTGSTDVGLLRPAPPGYDDFARVAYLVTDAGRPRHELLAIGFTASGRRIAAGALAARPDAEVEFADADAAGTTIIIGWNVEGRSEVELLDTRTVTRTPCPDLPGDVVAGVAMARDGSCAVLAIESPTQPRRLWRLDVAEQTWQPMTAQSLAPRTDLVTPELVHFDAHDGLPLSGWLYPARADGARDSRLPPAMLSLHGGPEAQERPVFSPQHQVLAAAGVTVFAPNIRGSSGAGRTFVHADDRWGRFDAIHDVAQCAKMLVARGLVDGARVAVTGRSYGGYATLMSLTEHAFEFAAGVDICGMSDMLTFYRDTEPWIAAAAVTKYGDPARDAALLAEISPLRCAEAIVVPLLVVHGELDTNVPRNEAEQIVARLRELDRDVDYLELAGEGHEYRRAESRLELLRGITRFLSRTLQPKAAHRG